MPSEKARKLIVAAEAARYEILQGNCPHRFSEFSKRYRDSMHAAGQIDVIYAGHQASGHLNTPMGKLTDQKYMLMRITAGVVVDLSVAAAALVCRTAQHALLQDRYKALDALLNQVAGLGGGVVSIGGETIRLLPAAETVKAIGKIRQCRNSLG